MPFSLLRSNIFVPENKPINTYQATNYCKKKDWKLHSGEIIFNFTYIDATQPVSQLTKKWSNPKEQADLQTAKFNTETWSRRLLLEEMKLL